MRDNGIFWVVATPIGNIGDWSPRAREVLQSVDAILAEDTRHSASLLNQFGINNRLISCHEHNEIARVEMVLERLSRGESLALISDAGTPLISDPGFKLVRALRAANIKVRTVPGASSVIAALSISGLPTDNFAFLGFVPAKAAARVSLIKQAIALEMTVVLLESVHRIDATFAALDDNLPAKTQVFVARELTKQFEESALLESGALIGWLSESPHRRKGEYVLAIEPIVQTGKMLSGAVDVDALMLALQAEGLSTKTIAKVLSAQFGENKKQLYQRLLELSEQT